MRLTDRPRRIYGPRLSGPGRMATELSVVMSDSGEGADVPVPVGGTVATPPRLRTRALRVYQPRIASAWGRDSGALNVSIDDNAVGADSPALGDQVLAFQDSGAGSDDFPDRLVFAPVRTLDQYSARVSFPVGESPGAAITVSIGASVPDTGSGASEVSILSVGAIRRTDAGVGVDALSAQVSQTLTDAGAAADEISIAQALVVALTDAMSGSDALSASVRFALTDAGAANDPVVVSQGQAIPVLDSGSGSSALSATVTLSIADTGAGADAPQDATVSAAVSDTATAAEIARIAGSVVTSIAEVATGTDALGTTTVVLEVPDTGAGAELISQVQVAALVSDVGGGVSQIVVDNVPGSRLRRVTFVFHSRRDIRFEL